MGGVFREEMQKGGRMRIKPWMLGLLLWTATPNVVFAQDWSVENDRTQEIVRRYQQLLERSPSEGFAFQKLLDYVGKGKGLDNLISEYRKKVESSPDNANFHLILGHLLKAKNDYTGALTHYERAVELKPDIALTWLSRGSAHLMLQHNDEATSDFEKALSLEKDKAQKQDILRKLSDLAFNQRDWERAQLYYDQLIELEPRNEYLRMEYAQILVRYKRYEKALEQYEALLKLAGRDNKTRATTMRDMGELYQMMGRDDDALKLYRDAMKLVASGNWLQKELRQRIVNVYRSSNRLTELVNEYESAWRSPNYDQSMEMAELYEELGMEDKALNMFKRASRLNGRSVDPRQKIIRILERRADEKAVIAAYKDLIRVAPGDSRFQFDLVRVYFRSGNRKEALSMLKTIEGRYPRDTDVHMNLADTFMRFEMRDEALRIYQKLVRLEPKNDAFILGLGEFYYQNGELDKAVETWTKILNSNLAPAEAHARLGQVLAEHGMVERGLTHFEKAVEIAPKELSVRRGLALAYEHARQWQKSIDAWTYVLNNADHALTANEARSRIINIYKRQNRLASKMREFKAAFESRPRDIQAGFFLAESHVRQTEYSDAEKIYDEIAGIARRNEAGPNSSDVEVDALVSLDKLFQQTGELKRAIETLQRLAELMPARSRDYFHRIAELSLRLYQDDQAVHYATLAVQANPDDAMAQARLGDIYMKMGNLESAALQYREAIDLDPRAHEIQMRLANILLELGKLAEAERLYRDLAQKAEDENLIHEAARRAVSLAEVDDRLEEIETEFFPLVYRSPAKPVYRKVLLEVYDRMTMPYVTHERFGVSEGRKDVQRLLSEIGSRALPVLVDSLQGNDVAVRATAIRLIGDLRQVNATVALANLIDNPADSLRVQAIMRVAQLGDSRAAPPLIRLLKDSDPNLREIAIWALGGVGGDAAQTALIDVLQGGQSWREQSLAAVGLGRIGGDRAASELVKFYATLGERRFGEYMGVAVVWALGRTQRPIVVNALRESAVQSSEDLSMVAGWGLAQVGNKEAIGALLDQMWGASPQARTRAATALIQWSSESSESTENVRVRNVLREQRLIHPQQGKVDVESLLRDLKDRSMVFRHTQSTRILKEHRNTVIGSARQAIADGRGAVVLSDFVTPAGTFRFGPVISKVEESDRTLFVSVLQEIRKDLGDIEKTTPQVQIPFLQVVSALGGTQDHDAVVRLLKSQSASVRAQAAATIGLIGQRKDASSLVDGLRDTSFEVRAQSAQSIGYLLSGQTDATAESALLVTTKDTFPSVQEASVLALGKMRSASAVPTIRELLLSGPTSLKIACLRALKSIDTDEARSLVERHKSHPDYRLREVANES